PATRCKARRNTFPPLSRSNAKCRAQSPAKTMPRERLPLQQRPRSGKQRLLRINYWERIGGMTCYGLSARASPSQKRRTNRITRTMPKTASTQQKSPVQLHRFPEENKFARSARRVHRPQAGSRQKNIRRGRSSQREPRRFPEFPSVQATPERARRGAPRSPTFRVASFQTPPWISPLRSPH